MGTRDLPTQTTSGGKGCTVLSETWLVKRLPSTQKKRVLTATDVYSLTTWTPAPTVRQMVCPKWPRKTSTLTGELRREWQYCSLCSSVFCLPLGVIKCICTCVWNFKCSVLFKAERALPLINHQQNRLSSCYILSASFPAPKFLLSLILGGFGGQHVFIWFKIRTTGGIL